MSDEDEDEDGNEEKEAFVVEGAVAFVLHVYFA